MTTGTVAVPAIVPQPPIAAISMPWDVALDDPVSALRAERRRLGDTFVVESAGDRYLFLFSSAGVRSFYDVDEDVASKGVADWRMLRRKVPAALFGDRRVLPHDLFSRTDAEMQLRSVRAVVDAMVAELRPGDTLDVFEWSRRLAHLVGLSSWGGTGSLASGSLEELLTAFDDLDAAEAFVDPARMAEIADSGHRVEQAALERAVAVLAPLIERRMHDGGREDDLLARIVEAWPDGSIEDRSRGAAADVVLVHLASMSNLFAALGWAILDVAARPGLVATARGEDEQQMTSVVLESIRCAQRSIMLRHVLRPVSIDVGGAPLSVEPGVTLATLTPLTNVDGPGLDRFDPDRWEGQRLVDPTGLAAKELVTTFGHGRHACPARSFSLRAISTVLATLFGRFDVELVDHDPQAVPGQIGGVARGLGPCRVELRRRSASS